MLEKLCIAAVGSVGLSKAHGCVYSRSQSIRHSSRATISVHGICYAPRSPKKKVKRQPSVSSKLFRPGFGRKDDPCTAESLISQKWNFSGRRALCGCIMKLNHPVRDYSVHLDYWWKSVLCFMLCSMDLLIIMCHWGSCYQSTMSLRRYSKKLLLVLLIIRGL